MTTHVIVTLNVTDAEKLAEYRAKAVAAVAKHGGTPLQVSSDPKALEGTRPAPNSAVILAFPDRMSAESWINDPDLADTHALRRASSDSWIVML